MDGLHVKITETLKTGEKSNFIRGNGTITMQKAGTFSVSIKEYEDEAKVINDKLAALYKQRDVVRADPKKVAESTNAINKLNLQLKAINEKYASVRWIYMGVSSSVDLTIDDFNKSFGKGLVTTTVEFSELWEGGGLVYIEAYFYDPVTDPKNPKGPKIQMQPKGKAPYGCFIKGKGESEVTTAEWKDKEGKLITDKVAFGSTVYLHVYTHALYGQLLDIKLQDGNIIAKDRDLHLTAAGADGSSSGRLDPLADDSHFVRRVSVHGYVKEKSPPPKGATLGKVIDSEAKKLDNGQYKKIPNVQKCVFAVFIERKWQYSGGTHEENFEIHPIVTLHEDPHGKSYNLSAAELKVAEDGHFYQGDLKGNSPVTVNELQLTDKKDLRERIDFVIGMFFDGTLNSYYNTEARQDFEQRHKDFEPRDTDDKSKKVVRKMEADDLSSKKGKYHYKEDSSYENDLSNPAILYKNYITTKTPYTYRVYTEGIGTNTRPSRGPDGLPIFNNDGSLSTKNYDTDDTAGFGLGQGKSGIIEKVRLGIEEAVFNIKKNLEPYQTIGTLTFDVFGFSRGAAAARHFVHEITLQSYSAEVVNNYRTGERHVYDHNGYEISAKYGPSTMLLPACGNLGYLLTEIEKTFDNLVIRFAGLYDTVPHHGAFQHNDVEDLGLKDIMQAKYTVHLVAADEHRANFSLVDIRCITGKEGGGETDRGIELYLPGVHCDVGGSYQDDKPERKVRIDAFDEYAKLKTLKYELIRQGWFEEKELYIADDLCKHETDKKTKLPKVLITDANYKDHPSTYLLNSNRERVSNQYSFIPLFMMMDFCKKKDVFINEENVHNKYKFTKNTDLLTRVWNRLKTHQKFVFKDSPVFKQPDIIYDSSKAFQALTEYSRRQAEGQRQLDQQTAIENTEIKTLRHNCLHWNSVYGEGMIDSTVQPYKPNKEGEKRIREIRG